MQALIMAAGVGSRLSRELSKPKMVFKIGDTTIIRHTVEMLISNGIDVAVVVGFMKKFIYAELEGLKVTYFNNPFYKVTNSMASLWFARNFIDSSQDLILANGDVYWEQGLLDKLLKDKHDAVMLSDVSRVDVGDYFFTTENGVIVEFGKDLDRNTRDCEYVGIAKLKSSFIPGFIDRMNALVDDGIYDKWWENILYFHINDYPVHVLDVEGLFWGEIDYIEDYQRIVNYVEKGMRS
jgi:choline kinase